MDVDYDGKREDYSELWGNVFASDENGQRLESGIRFRATNGELVLII